MFEIEDLLEPISDENKAGPDLRFDAGDLTFQTLKEFSTAVEPAMAEGDEGTETNWPGAVGLCISALREKSKDLELMTALAEAWARTEGIAGLSHGLELILRGVETYWDSLHPGLDPDDGQISLALRARWLNWLDLPKGYLQAVKQAPLLPVATGGSYTWLDHQNSALLDDATVSPERRTELLDAGVVSAGEWESSLGSVGPAVLRDMVGHLKRGLDTVKALAAFCGEHFDSEDEEPPDFYKLTNLLEEMHDYFRGQVGEDEPAVGGEAATGAGVAAVTGGPIATRDQAIRQLQEVGDYFRRVEPHSPISYLVARAVKWGSMPLDKLFRDVVRNDDVIEHIWETLGLDGSTRDGDPEA
jgi:type VI secretion system protein ImpA